MKKIFLTLGAVLIFGVASAQTQPTTTPKKETEGVQPAQHVNANEPLSKDAVVPAQDVTADHEKVTPKAKVTTDSTTTKRVRKSKKS